jgi:hypothetical protein
VLFVSVLCAGFSLSLSPDDAIDGRQLEVQALSDEIRVEARHWYRVPKKVFTCRARWILL